jgi:hypothetical protein
MATKTGTERQATAKRTPYNRSRVSNGKALFAAGVDARTAVGRRFDDCVNDVASDLGGWDNLSALQRALVRRASILNALCEEQEAKFVTNDPSADLEFLGIATDRLGRIADRLGLERVAKNVPTLAQYLDAVAEQKASGDEGEDKGKGPCGARKAVGDWASYCPGDKPPPKQPPCGSGKGAGLRSWHAKQGHAVKDVETNDEDEIISPTVRHANLEESDQ